MDSEKYKYHVYITYQSGKDGEHWSRFLEHGIERYRIPVRPSETKEAGDESGTPTPRRFSVYRDRKRRETDDVLEWVPDSNLVSSRFLLVICSPRSAKSPRIDREVRFFMEQGKEENIIPFIIDGTPDPESENQCYPPSLPTNVLGVTLSEGSRKEALIKVVARLLQVEYFKLHQRHLRAERRFMRRALALIAGILVVIVSLAGWTVKAQVNARERFESADELVRFLALDLSGPDFKDLPGPARKQLDEKVRKYYEKHEPDDAIISYLSSLDGRGSDQEASK
jgi:hypothetical protein